MFDEYNADQLQQNGAVARIAFRNVAPPVKLRSIYLANASITRQITTRNEIQTK